MQGESRVRDIGAAMKEAHNVASEFESWPPYKDFPMFLYIYLILSFIYSDTVPRLI